MIFDPPLIKTTLLKRYKRFLADVLLPDGEEITVHCPNPGSMAGLVEEGQVAWISDSQNPKRKLRYTLEMLQLADGTIVGVNTNQPNKITEEAVAARKFDFLGNFETLRREVRYGENSRIDLLLEGSDIPATYIEVKNVHFRRTPGLHEFPDSVTDRGRKHLVEMANLVDNGNRAIMFYVIQRADGNKFALARDCDPKYAVAFDEAVARGVEAYAIVCDVTPKGITTSHTIEIDEPVLTQRRRTG